MPAPEGSGSFACAGWAPDAVAGTSDGAPTGGCGVGRRGADAGAGAAACAWACACAAPSDASVGGGGGVGRRGAPRGIGGGGGAFLRAAISDAIAGTWLGGFQSPSFSFQMWTSAFFDS